MRGCRRSPRAAASTAYCFLASVFDEESADRLAPFVDAFKIASYELTHVPLIRYLLRAGKPVIVSTGAATLKEVADTVDAVRSAGDHGLMLMQCTAAYPAPLESLNVRAIPTMKAAFDLPVGLSDHSRDPPRGTARGRGGRRESHREALHAQQRAAGR